MFTDEFKNEAKALYPEWNELHEAIERGDPIVGRYLYDSTYTEEFSAEDILSTSSLSELQKKASISKRKEKLYSSYVSGKCYKSEKDRRKQLGCPRLYALHNDDDDAYDAFDCHVYGPIPECPKFSSGECWEKFDALGLKMK